MVRLVVWLEMINVGNKLGMGYKMYSLCRRLGIIVEKW